MTTKRQLSALFLGAALLCVPAFGQPLSPSQDDGAKRDMKDAGHESRDAVQDTGRGIDHGTKKVYHKTKHGAKKAWHKTADTTKGAVNGGKEGARRPE